MQTALAATLTRRLPVPDWLPPRLSAALTGRVVEVEIPKAVRLRLRSPMMIKVSEAAEKYRWVTGVDAEPGPWRNDLVPHTVKAMDTYGLPWLREEWICGVERAAKTNVMLNCQLWSVRHKPGNIFWLEPGEEDAGKNLKTKIIPMYRESQEMRKYLSDRADDTGKTLIAFNHGIYLFPASANSARTMANFFGLHNFGNEVDKFPPITGPEADPIKLLYKRGRDSKSAKFMFGSTPAGRFIYEGMLRCRQIWTWGPQCPHCGEYILMDDEHLIIPDKATADEIKSGEAPVFYACNICGVEWTESDRQMAYKNGRDLCIKGADVARPSTVGFHWPALPIAMVPLAEIAEKYLLAKGGDLSARRDYAHGYQCIDHKEDFAERKEDAILLLRDDRPEGLVPSVPISCITAVADMQKRGFWFKITAWGFGLELENWTLKTGFLDSWESLRKLFYESEFQDVAGNKHIVTLRGMDSGGGESEEYADLSRTAEAYLFACANPGMLLFKGMKSMTAPHRMTQLDRLPGTNKPLPGAVQLYTLNSKHYKDRLAAKLLVNPTDPGAWHLHKDIDVDFARQMCSEGRDEHGFWVNPKKRPNHFWDCSYMELALVEIAQVKFWQRPADAATNTPPPRRVYSEGVQR
jgi:phage terminase large subunit GpA-like protein